MQASVRQAQKSATRNKIIETAYRVFSEQGFSAATSSIAKEAGVSHGTIFVHFPTLNDLLVCLLEDFGEKIGTRLHSLSKQCGSMESLLEEHLTVLEENEAFYIRLISEKSLLPDEAKSTFVMIQSAAALHFSGVLEREIEIGTVKKLPVPMLFNTWLGLVHYYLLNKEFFAGPEESVLKRYRVDLISTYINLINEKN